MKSPVRYKGVLAIAFIIGVVSLLGAATAYVVKISVMKNVDISISSYGYENEMNIVTFTIETFNRGSVAYKARVRIDVLNTSSEDLEDKNEILFTAWGQEIEMYPGSRKITKLYWHSDEIADRKVRVRVYYADDIFEDIYDVNKKETISNAESGVFAVKNFHVYDDYVLFDITPSKDVDEVLIIPKQFQSGWIFEQKVLKNLKNGETVMVKLPYKPSVFTEENVALGFVGGSSTIYDEYEFVMEKKVGLAGFLEKVIDPVRLLFLNSM